MSFATRLRELLEKMEGKRPSFTKAVVEGELISLLVARAPEILELIEAAEKDRAEHLRIGWCLPDGTAEDGGAPCNVCSFLVALDAEGK